jgi:hypothetical protein
MGLRLPRCRFDVAVAAGVKSISHSHTHTLRTFIVFAALTAIIPSNISILDKHLAEKFIDQVIVQLFSRN